MFPLSLCFVPGGVRRGAVRAALLSLLVFAARAEPASAQVGPRVETRSGPIEGVRLADLDRFLGIPYAEPPVGALRWREPQPSMPWTEARAALVIRPPCAQLPSSNGLGSIAEDCLYLNVYRPAAAGRPGAARRPVLVWIHGGAGVSGSGNQYDGSQLALRGDLIVVTVSYRLGVFGSLALPELSAESSDGGSGNYGFADQQLALRWVRDNIARFGGNPDQVAVAGQSSGGASVCALLASPTARGLFQRAIIMSGAFDAQGDRTAEPCALASLAESEAQGLDFAERAACPQASGSPLDCLRSKSAVDLLASSLGFAARLNRSGRILPSPVLQTIASGNWNRVPVVVGSTRDELLPVVTVALGPSPIPEITSLLALGAIVPPLRLPEVFLEYGVLDTGTLAQPFGAALSDAALACPTFALRELLADRTVVYGFEFNDPDAPSGLSADVPTGAFHTSELPYLFAFAPSRGPLSMPQQALSLQIMRYFSAFARRGSPRVANQARWPRYRRGSRQVLSLEPGRSRPITSFSDDHHCDFWIPDPDPASPELQPSRR